MSNAPLAMSARLTTATNRARYLMNSRLRTIEALDAGSLRLFAGLPLPRWSDGALIPAFLALFAHPRGPATPKTVGGRSENLPLHSITSSASASKVGRQSRPFSVAHQHADPPHAVALLRLRGEGPRRRSSPVRRTRSASFNNLVSRGEQRRGHGETKCFRGFEIGLRSAPATHRVYRAAFGGCHRAPIRRHVRSGQ
jgi:hypothetical protein